MSAVAIVQPWRSQGGLVASPALLCASSLGLFLGSLGYAAPLKGLLNRPLKSPLGLTTPMLSARIERHTRPLLTGVLAPCGALSTRLRLYYGQLFLASHDSCALPPVRVCMYVCMCACVWNQPLRPPRARRGAPTRAHQRPRSHLLLRLPHLHLLGHLTSLSERPSSWSLALASAAGGSSAERSRRRPKSGQRRQHCLLQVRYTTNVACGLLGARCVPEQFG